MKVQLRRVNIPSIPNLFSLTNGSIITLDLQPGEYIAHIQPIPVATVLGLAYNEPHVIIAKHLDAEKKPAKRKEAVTTVKPRSSRKGAA